MKAWWRFRLRDILIGIAVFVATLGFWPPLYNTIVQRHVAGEIDDWLAAIDLASDTPDSSQKLISLNGNALLFCIRNWEEPDETTVINMPLTGDLYVSGPNAFNGPWATVGSEEEAADLWLMRVMEQHRWRWWKY